jgi:hypothetical protein
LIILVLRCFYRKSHLMHVSSMCTDKIRKFWGFFLAVSIQLSLTAYVN